MREWTLGPGDPLALTLAADFRLCTPDYSNDHIWELELGGGDPPALSLRTTFGLRARTMRIFPRFTQGGQTISDPAAFLLPPRLRRFFPNFISIDFSPLSGIDVVAEIWASDSHSTAGRFTVKNRGGEPVSLLLELCGQLAPLEGEGLAPLLMQSVNVLSGRCANLAPVLFLTGGPRFGPGPYPSLTLDLHLAAESASTLTWAQAALATPEESFNLARHTAARPWDAERAKIEMINGAQSVEIQTGDPEWDAAFALSQKTAFGLFLSRSQHLPHSSFVLTRQPDQGYSPHGDGSDYSHLWNGQSPLEAGYLASVLPGAPELATGLVRNFLASQSEDGEVDSKPGLAGQRGRTLASPLLANLAWQVFQKTHDLDFLREVQPGLEAFAHCWFDAARDRDGDGFPEWDHPLQTGLEDNPAFNVWQSAGQGAEISCTESPALAALLCRETLALAHIAEALGQPEARERWELESGHLRALCEECWDADTMLYHLRDRDTHCSPKGKTLGIQRGNGKREFSKTFQQPVRLLVRLELKGDAIRHPGINVCGDNSGSPQTEHIERKDFHWSVGLAVATTQMVYTGLAEIEVTGLEKYDRVVVSVMDFSAEDVSLFLPMWAGVPNSQNAQNTVKRNLLAPDRFGGVFGTPMCPASSKTASASCCQAVYLPWNALIGEGLLGYGLQAEAAGLTSRLMGAVIKSLKQQHAFAHAYDAESGAGIGDRNPVQGLAPLGLFLETLGVRIESQSGNPGDFSKLQVVLHGKNPFPWPVTVKYRGLTITRSTDQTVVNFPNGQTVTLEDPTDVVVSG